VKLVAELLREFIALATPRRKATRALLLQAARLRAELLDAIEAEFPPEPLEVDMRRLVTEAALVWRRFATAGGEILVDSVGVHAVAKYPVDVVPDDLHDRLMRIYGWTRDELIAMEERRARIASNLPVKRAIADALARECGDDAAARLRLFRALYGDVPFLESELELVLTSTMLFVLVPDESDDPVLRAWLDRVDAAVMSTRTIRFPAFGLYEREAVDRALLARLGASLGLAHLPPQVVERTLETMVMLVPTPDIERFLLHDVWGHCWQETLLDLEWPMQELSRGEREAHCLIVSELLADLVEHKLVREQPELRLPSSSLLPNATLKLDLSLHDIQRLGLPPHMALVSVVALDAALTRLIERGEARLDLVAVAVGYAYEQGIQLARLADFVHALGDELRKL